MTLKSRWKKQVTSRSANSSAHHWQATVNGYGMECFAYDGNSIAKPSIGIVKGGEYVFVRCYPKGTSIEELCALAEEWVMKSLAAQPKRLTRSR